MQQRQSNPSAPEAELPKKIGGRYDVVRMIGEGAMGRVLLAHDPVLGRDVAVKLLRDDLRIPTDVRDGLVIRMRHEARAAARVAHPNLVTLHDMGEDPHCGLYLVFEYVEGPTLKHRLLDGPLSPGQAARLSRELGAALSVAHRAGIVHRDIKPENVILSNTGGKIADFGIARIPDSTLTHQGGLLGTPAYSAPETFKAGKFSPESDQFSLAASLYEAISGRRAFPGDDAALVASKIATDVPERFAHYMRLPPALDEVLARAMAKEASSRYPSCEEFGEAMAQALAPAVARDIAPSLPSDPTALGPTTATATEPMRTPIEVPPWHGERKTGQVALGATVVVVTAALLLHTALRSAEKEETDPLALTTASAAPSTSAKSRPPAANPPPSRPVTARPKNSAAETPSALPSSSAAAVVPDAGASDAAAAAPSTDAGAPASATPKADGGGG